MENEDVRGTLNFTLSGLLNNGEVHYKAVALEGADFWCPR